MQDTFLSQKPHNWWISGKNYTTKIYLKKASAVLHTPMNIKTSA